MQVEQNLVQAVPVLRVVGDIDHAGAPALRESIDSSFASGGSCMLLDLEFCPYLDSGGVGVLLDTIRRVRPRGWLGVVGANPDVLRILSYVGLIVDPHFRVFADLDEVRTALPPT
jgi:anti-sigma B factor antagonist